MKRFKYRTSGITKGESMSALRGCQQCHVQFNVAHSGVVQYGKAFDFQSIGSVPLIHSWKSI